MPADYVPINCDYYDDLTVLVMHRRRVPIRFLDAGDDVVRVEDVIEDVYTHGSEEFVRLASGLVIRLDRLLAVDGKPVPPRC